MCALSVEEVSTGKRAWEPRVVPMGNTVAASARENTDFLDRVIPLDGASHAEVEKYTVEIPMRYAICFAILTDGRKVKLRDSRKFLGWSGWGKQRSYLFRNDDQYIEVKTNLVQCLDRPVPGNVCSIVLGSPVSEDQSAQLFFAAVPQDRQLMAPTLNEESKFIAPDGNQLVLTGGCLMLRELSQL